MPSARGAGADGCARAQVLAREFILRTTKFKRIRRAKVPFVRDLQPQAFMVTSKVAVDSDVESRLSSLDGKGA